MQNVLITGVGRGLGLAISQRLAGEGYRILGLGRSLSDAYGGLMKAAAPDQVHFVEYDLNDLSGIPALVKDLVGKHGNIYGLVNNAGIGLDGVLATQHASDISSVLRVNLEAPITLTKYVSRSMLKIGGGRIINISSIIASTGFNGLAVYASSKAGLEGFTRSLSRELGRARITVNCVAPGYMETDMVGDLQGEKLQSIKRRSPLGLAKVEDCAGAVSYLIGKDGERITGSIITVDGGSTA